MSYRGHHGRDADRALWDAEGDRGGSLHPSAQGLHRPGLHQVPQGLHHAEPGGDHPGTALQDGAAVWPRLHARHRPLSGRARV